MKVRTCISCLLLIGVFCSPGLLATPLPPPDIFATEPGVQDRLSTVTHTGMVVCSADTISNPLPLNEAIEQMLCQDPSIRQAWWMARIRAAQVGQKKAAYLPRLDAQISEMGGHSAVDYNGHFLKPTGNHRTRTGRIDLHWLLFDFGRRGAALDAARQLLIAANADRSEAVQTAFLQAAQLYFSAQAAALRISAAEQVLAFAEDNYAGAGDRYMAGVAALSDRVQAQTALTQASLRLSREREVCTGIHGEMTLRMGMSLGLPVRTVIDAPELPAPAYLQEADALIARARERHPVLLAAEARYRAAKLSAAEVRAMGRPTLALTGNLGQVQSRQSPAFGGNNERKDASVGLQLTIPLFRGFEQHYRNREAQANINSTQAELDAARQRISLDVWKQYSDLKREGETLLHTKQLVEQSKQALDVVGGRYQSGVGNMTEVLNAMNAYASAQEQHIDATTRWKTARLGLAAGLGNLGFWEAAW